MRRMQILLADFRQDARYAARLLWRNPLFALTAALVLSIGIGATTTIFTVANGLLLRGPAGAAEPDRLVDLYETDGGSLGQPVINYQTYLELRERITRLDSLYAYELELTPTSLRGADGAERVFTGLVTTNYFSVIGVAPATGRLLSPRDSDEPGASPLAVLSHRFWSRRFNADPTIVGTTVQLNGQSFTVIGVAAEGFTGTSVVAPDIWAPIAMTSVFHPGTTAPARGLRVAAGGRLKPGMTLRDAAAEIETLGHTLPSMRLSRDVVTMSGSRTTGAAGLRLVTASPIPGNIRPLLAGFLALLIGLVSIVLVIACANIAGVLLARAAARRREIAVRLAIGAGRRRLIRQLVTETLLLFLLGGVAGLLLARILTSTVVALLPAFPQPVALSLPLDGRVFLFTLTVSLIAAVLSGLAPALQASRTDVLSALNADAQGPVDRLRLRSAFVIAQVAFSIALVVAAGLLVRALDRVTLSSQAMDPHGVQAVSIDLGLAGYNNTTGPLFARALAERLRALPGVQSASIADRLPRGNMLSSMPDEGLLVPGMTPPHGLPFFTVSWTATEPDYFSTLRIPLVAGRDFNVADTATSQRVVIVTESTARRLWPGQEAIGKYVIWQKGRPDLPSPTPPTITRLLVVGVARDLRDGGSPRGETPALALYAPLQQRYSPGFLLFARSADGPRALNAMRALVVSMDPNLPIIETGPLDLQLLAPPVIQLQVAASVAGSIGVIGLLLAAIGLYGVTAYNVARRTREIGIRIALGAERGDVVGMVLRQGMTLVGIGSLVGLVLAAGVGRLLRSMLFGLPTLDPLTFGGAAILFAVIGLAACYIPARRATQVDAMEALRYE
jgi:predicted permease